MAKTATLFLCGDVMLGRGIDQILPHPGDPELHEPAIRSAAEYVALAEGANGPIPVPVAPDYVWGEALGELCRNAPDARIVNLETSITTHRAFAPKGINYRMNPANVGALTAARIDCCALANNHVLDFGEAGLRQTLATLESAGIRTAGAGLDGQAARMPAIIPLPGGGRVVVFAFGCASSGVPAGWAAGPGKAGVNRLRDLSRESVDEIADFVRQSRRSGDLPVASIHWGGNFGYDIPEDEVAFAHALIERAGFAVVHGHSSHHPKAIEIHRGRPIFYGCGDFINDYEGVGGYEMYRGDLALMYLPRLDLATGRLVDLKLVPFRISRFRLQYARRQDAAWLCEVLARESARFGTRVSLDAGGSMHIGGC